MATNPWAGIGTGAGEVTPAGVVGDVAGSSTGSWWAYYLPGVVGQADTELVGAVRAPSKEAAAQDVANAEAGTPASDVKVWGPYSTQQEAANRAAQVGANGDTTSQSLTGLGNAAASTLGNPLTGLAAIGDFFSRLTEADTWIRVGKVLAGGVLLIIGLAHMTGAENGIAKIARNVPVPV